MKVYSVNCLLGIVVDGNSFHLLSNSYIAKNEICLSPKACEIERFRRKFRFTGYLRNVLLTIFKKILLSPKMAAILNFRIIAKTGKTQICFYLLNRVR